MQPQDAKNKLRQQIRAQLKSLAPERRAADSVRACSLLEQQPVWKNASAILFYAPLPEELDVWPLVRHSLSANKTVALPRFDPAAKSYLAGRIQNLETDLQSGEFGIREPAKHCVVVPFDQLDLVLVPGVAFDPGGRRLGRGKGFYDRLLALVRGATCGVAFEEQLVAELPVEPHDVRVNWLVTPGRWIQTTK